MLTISLIATIFLIFLAGMELTLILLKRVSNCTSIIQMIEILKNNSSIQYANGNIYSAKSSRQTEEVWAEIIEYK